MTIDEVINQKYKTEERKKEALARLQERLMLSRSQMYKKRKGLSPLTLEQAKSVAEVLKVPVSKLAAVFMVFLSLASCQSSGNGPIPREIILDGCTYAVHKLEGNPVLIHREECGNHRHRNSEVIYWDEYRTGQYVQ
jgi:hypothetical protein